MNAHPDEFEPPFEILEPAELRGPVAFNSPHSGSVYPPAFLAAARLDLLDLDLVETHDCFTIAELIEYEAMGLTAPGEGLP